MAQSPIKIMEIVQVFQLRSMSCSGFSDDFNLGIGSNLEGASHMCDRTGNFVARERVDDVVQSQAAKRDGSTGRNCRPIAVDLFAGVGGLSLGFEQAGFDVVAAVEYDPIHAAVHKFNFPAASVICADIADEERVSIAAIKAAIRRGIQNHDHDDQAWDGQIDVVFGGPPCQGFSTIGKRDVDDSRNSLVFQFARIVEGLRPRYFVMENVRGMALGAHSQILQRLIERLRTAGYKIDDPQILNAKDFGVPQDRRRVILIGSRNDCNVASHPKPIVNPMPKNGLRRQARIQNSTLPDGPTVWNAIHDLSELDRRAALLRTDEIAVRQTRLKELDWKASPYASILRGIVTDATDFSYQREWDRASVTNSMLTAHDSAVIIRFAATAKGSIEPQSRFHRLHPNGLCSTLRAGTGSERGAYTSARPIHPYKPRVITVREAARLQSFPDWFRFHRTKWHGFRQVGNSVPPMLGRAIASSLLKAMQHMPMRPSRSIPLGDKALLEMNYAEAAGYFGIPKKREYHYRRTIKGADKKVTQASSNRSASDDTCAA